MLRNRKGNAGDELLRTASGHELLWLAATSNAHVRRQIETELDRRSLHAGIHRLPVERDVRRIGKAAA